MYPTELITREMHEQFALYTADRTDSVEDFGRTLYMLPCDRSQAEHSRFERRSNWGTVYLFCDLILK